MPPALQEPHLKGFPKGSGLSGHSLVPMVARGNQVAALVIGREGSLRTQRRHGNSYILRGRISLLIYSLILGRINGFSGQNESGDLGTDQSSFVYTEMTSTTASRSYHTTIPVTEHEALTVGGRVKSFLDTVTTPNEVVLDVESGQCKAVVRLIERFIKTASPPVPETRLNQMWVLGRMSNCFFLPF